MKVKIKAIFTAFIFGLLLGSFSMPTSVDARVEAQARPPIESPQPDHPYFSATPLKMADGKSIEEDKIGGPPIPPLGYQVERAAVALPAPNSSSSINALTVPTYDWVFGCSAVSAAMIAGYYDNQGYPNMYTGPTNAGLAPYESSYWSPWTDGHNVYPNNPLVASHQGLDGWITPGSLDDYWVAYNSSAPDPYLTGGWSQHTWGAAIGDYMKTSQSAYDNPDGSTSFYNWISSAAPLTCHDMETYGVSDLDGTYGRMLFYQARGYPVTGCYNQKTDNQIAGGFSFAQYQAEIDAGQPVLLNLEGHSIAGVGYAATTNTVYLHDTWDYQTHSMTWGGSYTGMRLLSVSIVHLAASAPPLPPTPFEKTSPIDTAANQPTDLTLSWTASSGASSYEYQIFPTDTITGSVWISSGTANQVQLSGLSYATSYSWQVRAVTVGGTSYANDSETAFWSFSTAPPAKKNIYLPLVTQ